MYYGPSDFAVADRAADIEAGRGVKPAQIALAWLLSRPAVAAPIVGASRLSHLDEAVAALAIRLDADEIRRLEEPYTPHPVLGHS
jgi:1-deoxyxylulose-5-phosphate synthase